MKLRTLFICAWMFCLAGVPLSASQMSAPSKKGVPTPVGPKIKVLLEKDVASAFLEARGSYKVIRKDSGSVLSSGSMGKRFVIHALQDGLRWGEEYPDVYQITLVPTTRTSSIFVNGVQYKGTVSIFHVRNNHITIVNEVAIEEFLKSTLAVQFEEPLPKEAMAAIAIAARTEAYSRVLQGQSITRPWDISAQEAGYFGFGVTQRKNGVDEAIEWTRFMVLESTKQEGPAQNVRLAAAQADDLAKKGFDAQKILTTTFPQTKIGITIKADDVAIR